MIRVIMGKKGTGKTKQMIDLINSAVHSEHGNVVSKISAKRMTLRFPCPPTLEPAKSISLYFFR